MDNMSNEKNINKKFISERISRLCTEKNISEREVSFLLGKNHSYISTVISGRIMPTIESLFDICKFFEITPYEFFNPNFEQHMNYDNVKNEIFQEAFRISEGNVSEILAFLKSITADDFSAFLLFVEKFQNIRK